jgi:hypothetical protein
VREVKMKNKDYKQNKDKDNNFTDCDIFFMEKEMVRKKREMKKIKDKNKRRNKEWD